MAAGLRPGWPRPGRAEAAEAQPAAPGSARRATSLARLADGYVLASALFLIGWVTLFRMAFAAGRRRGPAFAAELIHPLADLILLGACLPLAAAAGRRGAIPYLACSPSPWATRSRSAPGPAARTRGSGALLVQLAGLALLALRAVGQWRRAWRGQAPAGQAARRAAPAAGRRAVTSGGRTAAAAVAAGADAGTRCPAMAAVPGVATARRRRGRAAAALIIIGWALAGERGPAGARHRRGTTLLVLALRAPGCCGGRTPRSGSGTSHGQQFRQLAERTTDVVLLCDLSGVIRYASRAVTGYGYTPEALRGHAAGRPAAPRGPGGRHAGRSAGR